MKSLFSMILTGAVALAFMPAGAFAQETGSVAGQVTDQVTGEPLVGAQVLIVGTNRGTVSNEEGRYLFNNVQVGARQVRVISLGYASQTLPVTVATGETAVLNFALEQSAVALDELVVTVTGEQRQRELANAVSNIQAAEVVQESPITTMSELIQGRATGVIVRHSAGTTGSGARIRIRGSNSVSLSNEPIIYIDGVRVYSAANALSIGTGGQSTSRINDINPENIESIEIVKGPSAATLYGTDAANGVIRITTKQGTAGDPKFNFYIEGGTLSDENEYPLNYRGFTAPDAEGNRGACFLVLQGLGACQQDSIAAFTPLDDDTFQPFSTGNRQQYGLSVSGGGDRINYYIAGEFESERGVIELPDTNKVLAIEEQGELFEHQTHPNELDRVNVRANLGAQVTDDLRVNVNTGYLSSDLTLPENDNSVLGLVSSGFLGFWTPDINNGWGFFQPHDVLSQENAQSIERFTGSLNANWAPANIDWLTARAALGLDYTNRHDNSFFPVGGIAFGNLLQGARISNRINVFAYTADLGASAAFDISPDIGSRTSAGVQYFRDDFRGTFASGEILVPGSKSINAAARTFSDEATTEDITLGTYIEQQFSYRDRLFVTGGLRADDNSAFGQDFDLIIYPKIGASYVAIDEQGEPLFDFVNSLRLRGAYGESGLAPGTTDALRFFNATAVSVRGQDVGGITFGELGNPGLEPESSREYEAGFDAGLFDGRIGLEATYYNKQTEDALIERDLPPSLGVGADRFENLGSVKNEGIEGAIDAVVVDRENIGWDFRISGSHNENTLLELGEGIEPIIFGTQRHKEGFPLGGYFGPPLSVDDANEDGIVTPGEINVGVELEDGTFDADSVVFLGNSIPEDEISLSSSLTLFDIIRVSGLLDYKGGFMLDNFTENFRCQFAICRGLNDPDASLQEQARGVQTAFVGGLAADAAFVEEGDFWKLREVSVTLFAPDEWAQYFGGEAMNLVLTGRNLATWTDYTGLDPELNSVGPANFSSFEFLTQPPVRYFLARLNVTF